MNNLLLEFVKEAISEAKYSINNYKNECYGLVSMLPCELDENGEPEDKYCLLMIMKIKDKNCRNKINIACYGHAFLENDFKDFIPLMELFAKEEIELVIDVKGDAFMCGTDNLKMKLNKIL